MTTLPAAEDYRAKVRTAADAVAGIPNGADIAIGMAVAEPPALLAALAARVEAGELAGLRPWYNALNVVAGTMPSRGAASKGRTAAKPVPTRNTKAK